MIKTTFSEFRQNAKHYFDEVAKGETVQVSRYGKVVAEVALPKKPRIPLWKRPGIKLKAKGGVSASDMVIKERDEEYKKDLF